MLTLINNIVSTKEKMIERIIYSQTFDTLICKILTFVSDQTQFNSDRTDGISNPGGRWLLSVLFRTSFKRTTSGYAKVLVQWRICCPIQLRHPCVSGQFILEI